MTDTIFAVSSGSPPAAIAVIRVSGPEALATASAIVGDLPPPRYAALRLLRDNAGKPLDRALVLVFPGPHSATGEDVVELHVHGGRAVVGAVLAALRSRPGLRDAMPGEFTRRALLNGIIDTAQAEGLADLLAAETEDARVAALTAAEGAVGRQLRHWHDNVLALRAIVEAAIDYADEGDVDLASAQQLRTSLALLVEEMRACLAGPTAERTREGALVVLAGPPNAGKSSLLNALVEREAAIVTPVAGTTRDVIDVAVEYGGKPYRIVDTAGLRNDAADPVERLGVKRAQELIDAADLLLWLGDAPPPQHQNVIHVHARMDQPGREEHAPDRRGTSINDRQSIGALWGHIAAATNDDVGTSRRLVLRQRQADAVAHALEYVRAAEHSMDELTVAEHLRLASSALSEALGLNSTEAMLDALFSRFCLGK